MTHPELASVAARTFDLSGVYYRVSAEAMRRARVEVRAYAKEAILQNIADVVGRRISVPLHWRADRRYEDGSPADYVCRPVWPVLRVPEPFDFATAGYLEV